MRARVLGGLVGLILVGGERVASAQPTQVLHEFNGYTSAEADGSTDSGERRQPIRHHEADWRGTSRHDLQDDAVRRRDDPAHLRGRRRRC